MSDQDPGEVSVPPTTGRQVWAKDEGAPWWPAKVVESGYVLPHEIPEDNSEEISELTKEQLETEEESRIEDAGEWAEELRVAISEAKEDLETGLKMQLSLKTAPNAQLRTLPTADELAAFDEFDGGFDDENGNNTQTTVDTADSDDEVVNAKKEKKRLKKAMKEKKRKDKASKKKNKEEERAAKEEQKAQEKEEREEKRLNAKKRREVDRADETRAIKRGREEMIRDEESRKRAIKTDTLEVLHEELITAIELQYLSKQREVLSRLAYVQPTLVQLKDVGIGKTVVKLINSPLQPLAKCIVQLWKSYLPEIQPMPKEYSKVPEAENEPAAVIPSETQQEESPLIGELSQGSEAVESQESIQVSVEGNSVEESLPTDASNTAASDAANNDLVSLNHEGKAGDYRSNILQKIVDALSTPDSNGKVVEMIVKEPTSVNQIAGAIVNQLEVTYLNDQEKQLKKLKQIVTSLQDPKNAEFRELVLYKPSPYHLVKTMTAADMANPDIKKERKETTAYETEAMRLDYHKPAITRQFRCGRCKQNKTIYMQMQTRSADEPMTTFVNCVNCGNAWKFC